MKTFSFFGKVLDIGLDIMYNGKRKEDNLMLAKKIIENLKSRTTGSNIASIAIVSFIGT